MRWVARVACLAPLPAWGQAADLVDLSPVARQMVTAAERLAAEGDLDGALARLRAVLAVSPGHPGVTLRYGAWLAREGRSDEALAAWDALGMHTGALVARIELLRKLGRHEEALDAITALSRLQFGWEEPVRLDAVVRLGLDDARGVTSFERWWNGPETVHAGPGAQEAVAALANYHRRAGRTVDALTALDRLESTDPAGFASLGALQRELEVDLEAIRWASRERAAPLTADQWARFRAIDEGSGLDGLSALEALASESADARVWLALARARLAAGQVEAAVEAAARAERLAPLLGEPSAWLGRTLATWFPHTHDAEAIAAMERALRKPDADWSLWMEVARLRARQGDWAGARAAAARYVDVAPNGPLVDVAQRWSAEVPPAPLVPPAPAIDELDDAHVAVARAHVLFALYGDEVGALDVLNTLGEDPSAEASRLRGVLLGRLGRHDDAIDAFRAAAVRAPRDAGVWEGLAEALDAAGDDGHEARKTAAELGSCGAALTLSERSLDAWRWSAARGWLARCATVGMTGAQQKRWNELHGALQATRRAGWIAGGLAAGMGLLGAMWWWRRKRGVDLDTWLERRPSVRSQVAGSLAALRHEVLKHHLSHLDRVADAIDAGDAETVLWAAEALGAADGPLDQLERHVDHLEALARGTGVPLDLRRCDPTFSTMHRAGQAVSAIIPDLTSGGSEHAAKVLRAAAPAFDAGVARSLSTRIADASMSQVSTDVLRRLWDRVCHEPGLPGAASLRCDVVGDAECWIRVATGDLEDVVTNVVRNAVSATLDHGGEALAMRLQLDDDPITGVEYVEVWVCDAVPAALTTASIRERYVEHGLGLVVELLNQSSGSIRVAACAGWEKAVVVRWPTVERRGEGEA